MKKRLRTRNVAVPDRNVSERFQMSLEISNTTFENVQTATVNRFFQELSMTSVESFSITIDNNVPKS